jgi:hypothetical protein
MDALFLIARFAGAAAAAEVKNCAAAANEQFSKQLVISKSLRDIGEYGLLAD